LFVELNHIFSLKTIMMNQFKTTTQKTSWKLYSFLLLLCLCASSSTAFAQIQKGLDVDGEAAGDQSGSSISMPDANTIAIGATWNDANGSNAGHVRIYSWNGTAWIQKGLDIDGEAAGDQSGSSISMPDVNTVAIGAPYNDANGSNAGHVRIYSWDGTAWIQKGLDIDGEAAGDLSGVSVSMPDTNTLAIGATWNGSNGSNAGHVRIYEWNGTAWIQKGLDIDGEAAFDYSGVSVSMPDANTVAIGAPNNDGNGSNAGHVRIYSWNGTAWVQKGLDIDGEAANDWSGYSVSMPDTNTIAIGAPYNDANGSDAGHVRIYSWNGTAWVQKGLDIDGEAANDWSGYSVSMPDTNTIAIGAPYNDANGSDAGHVRIYSWNGTAWIQKGLDIDGEAANDWSGGWGSVSMPDANTVAIGARNNDDNGSDAGHVRIYSVCTTVNGTDTHTECNSYMWIDGNTYTSSNNTATFNIAGGAANGCDSLVTLDLTIIPSATGTDTRTECNSYTWIDGNTYNSSNNTATFNIVGGAANGCDSLVTLDLTINSVSDLTTSITNNVVSANNTAASYQWLDCDNSFAPILGETTASYAATASGNYAVELTENGCVDTSSCVNVTISSVLDNPFSNSINLFPNPTTGQVNVVFEQELSDLQLRAFNALGQEVYRQDYARAKQLDFNLDVPSGIYLIELVSEEQKAVFRLVKE
jgi:hypothetical protein